MTTLEQVPQYSLKHLDDGQKERLQLEVKLPGVRSAAELLVHITAQKISVRVQGRYRLELPLDVRVADKPEKLRFVKKTEVLKAELEVLGPALHPKAKAESKPIHNSFLEEALRMRDSRCREALHTRGGSAQQAASGRETAQPQKAASVPASIPPPTSPPAEAVTKPPTEAPANVPQAASSLPSRQIKLEGTGLRRGFFPAPLPPESDIRGPATADTTSAEECSCSTRVEPDPPLRREKVAHSSAESKPSARAHPREPEPEPRPTPRQPSNENIYAAAKEQMNREAAEGWYRRGMEALRAHDYDKAARMLQKACKLAPEEYCEALEMVEVMQDVIGEPGGVAAPAAGTPKDQPPLEDSRSDDGSGDYDDMPDLVSDSEQQHHENREDAEEDKSCDDESLDEDSGGCSPQPARGHTLRRTVSTLKEAAASVLMFVVLVMCHLAARVWALVPGVLPRLGGMLGQHELADRLALAMHRRSRSRSRTALLAVSAAVGAAVAVVAGTVAFWALHLALSILCNSLLLLGRCAVGLLHLAFWTPTWYMTWPLSGFLLWQRRLLLLHLFWSFPAMWWAVGGGWWAVVGSVAAFGLAMLGAGVLLSSAAWVLISWQLRLLPWWLSFPAALLTLGGWLFLGSAIAAARHAEAEDSGGTGGDVLLGRLSTAVPRGAKGEVARVLGCSDYFQVLEVDPNTVKDDQVRRAMKMKALVTHPDKLGDDAVGAALAFQRITEAADVLGEEASRRQYRRNLAAAANSERHRRGRGGAEGSSAESGGMGMHMHCPSCQGEHLVLHTDIPLSAARWCDKCHTRHPARDGDGWLESTGSLFAAATKVYLATDGVVYDITSWAECGDLTLDAHGNPLPANTHVAPLRFSSSMARGSGRGRPGGPTSPPSAGGSGGFRTPRPGKGKKKGPRRR